MENPFESERRGQSFSYVSIFLLLLIQVILLTLESLFRLIGCFAHVYLAVPICTAIYEINHMAAILGCLAFNFALALIVYGEFIKLLIELTDPKHANTKTISQDEWDKMQEKAAVAEKKAADAEKKTASAEKNAAGAQKKAEDIDKKVDAVLKEMSSIMDLAAQTGNYQEVATALREAYKASKSNAT